jgi:hypothetical protein
MMRMIAVVDDVDVSGVRTHVIFESRNIRAAAFPRDWNYSLLVVAPSFSSVYHNILAH